MKLLLLDSHALIHRAYHAINTNLASPTGEPTNATYGFTSTVLHVLSTEKPDLIAATFDVGKSFRDEIFAEYKAHRPELADDLRPQLQRSREIVEALNIPSFGMEGYEADDLLGTLARQATERGIETVIVTGDTDTLQLVDPHVRVLMFSPQTGGGFTLYDEKAVRARYQLDPKQLIDLKALKGDTSDNIPGVLGIGEKTATNLVSKYGSIENIYARLDEIEKRWQEKLRAGQKQAHEGKKLVTIVTDAPVKLDPDACRVQDYNRERIIALFREMGFKSLIDRLPTPSSQRDLFSSESSETKPETVAENYHTVNTEAALDQLIARLKSVKEFVFDVETTSTDPMRAVLVGIAIGVGKGEAYYIPIKAEVGTLRVKDKDPEQGQLAFDTKSSSLIHHAQRSSLSNDFVLAKLKPIFEDARITKSAHNAKYDLTVLAEAGVDVHGLAFDSMIAAHLVEPSNQSVGLKNLVFLKFGVEMTEIEALIGKGKNQISMAEVDSEKASSYACADADYTYRLVEHYKPLLAEQGVDKLFHDVEMPLVPVLMEIERTGVLLDLTALSTLSAKLTARLHELDKQIQAYCGTPINIASPVQLADALFNRLKLPTARLPKTKTGQISTAAEVLESLRAVHPIIPLILEHRELSKLKGTYVDALPALVHPRTGRVHTDYNQTGTVTGRVSSSNPNLQNIPIRTDLGRLVRRAFIAPPGSQLISADYSQVELRILAHITHDPGLLEAFAHGEDIHAATAARLFNVPLAQVTSAQRRLGKTINFGIAYGITDYGVAARTELSQAESRQLIENYFVQFAKVKAYIDRTKREASERGYVQTLLGRRRYFPELRAGFRGNPGMRNAAEREAINMPIQGCLPFQSKVLTSAGYRPIGQLYQQVCEGLEVWTGTRFAPFKVLNRGLCELAELELANGQVFRCDTRHEVLVVTEEGYHWKHYNQLAPGDRVARTLPQEIDYGVVPNIRYEYKPTVHNGHRLTLGGIDPDFFYWLGFYFGDGWISHKPKDFCWCLSYSIGAASGSLESDAKPQIEKKVRECNAYFGRLGLSANVRWQSSRKAEVKIHSRGLIEFFEEIGVNTHAVAQTKRVPEIVFQSPLSFRKSFLRGMLDADGYHGSKGASNPTIHLCQRGLLEDLLLLFRTVGVEAKLRGPYTYKDHTSYRLDLIGGMTGKNLGFTECDSVRIPAMRAPKFLVSAFLDVVSSADLSKHSHQVLYSRLKAGGSVSIYTLAEMTEAANKSLPVPLLSWSNLIRKRALGITEETYTLAVDDPLHCFDSEGIISKNTAADIIKIAMIRLHQELHQRGLRTRMTLQVHDELVFESPDDEIRVVVPLVREIMENAFQLESKLKVDLTIGQNWDEQREVNG